MHDVEDRYALSPLQQGMLFHSLRERGTGMYISQSVSRYEDLDPEAMRVAWQMAIERHSILRTSFHWDDPEHPEQAVHRAVVLPFDILDWRGLSPSDQSSKLRHFQQDERERGFDLTHPPLLRIAVIRVTRSRWLVVNTHHHLILDGWSGGILAAELARSYEATRQGRSLSLPDTRPFGDYIRWLESRSDTDAEDFWRRYLAGLVEATPLPMDAGDASSREPGGTPVESWTTSLDDATTQGLDRLARRCRVTLTTLVQAAWALVLSGHSGQKDVLFGLVVSGRPPELDGVESIVGMFLNTVPFRIRVDPDARLSDWLAVLQQNYLELQDFQHSPLMRIQQWSEMAPGKPLFGSIIARKDVTRVGQSGVPTRRANRGNRAQQSTFQQSYPLLLNITATDGLELKLTYATGRFATQDVVRVMEQLRAILDAMTADPERAVKDIPMMSDAERTRVLDEWSRPRALTAPRFTLHQLVECSAQQHAEQVALDCDPESPLSFRELDLRANHVARKLAAIGVAPGQRIALYGEPSPATVIALLAILKRGAAYMPLDPGRSATETSAALSICCPSFLLLQTDPPPGLDSCGVPTISLHYLDLDNQVEASTDASITPCADDLAYILATHNADGALTWVAISHAAAVQRAFVASETTSDGERTLLRYPIDSAVFQWELFSAWMRGSAVRLPPRILWDDPAALIEQEASGEHVRLVLPPMLLRTLVEREAIRDPSDEAIGVMQIVSTGESPDSDLHAALMQRIPGITLHNLYSSVETGPAACCVMGADEARSCVLLGHPLAGVRIYILDPDGRPCPIGIPGELHVGGSALASEGLAQHVSDRSSLPFLPDPISTIAGDRVFRTGDIGRWRTNGSIELLGHRDDCLSDENLPLDIRRVERLLRQHALVKQAAVVVRSQTSVAAWLVTGSQTPDLEELHRALARELPSRLLPDRYIHVEALPLTPSGTIDRKRLRSSSAMGQTVELRGRATAIEPETHLEKLIGQVWKDVLRQDELSVDDNFFELGGHSLSATRVASRLTRLLQREVPLSAVFETPTIRTLAQWIENAEQDAHLPVAIDRVARGKESPSAFTQRQLWVLAQLFPDIPAYTIPSNMQFQGDLDLALLERAILQIIERHEILRTTFTALDGEPWQVVHPTPHRINIPVADLSAIAANKREFETKRLMRQQGRLPWDLERGPLLRCHVISLSASDHIVNTVFHHIIADGPSVGIFSRELERLYTALVAGTPKKARLPRLSLQYSDFAIWERDSVKGDLFERQLRYWRETLQGSLPLEVPPDLPRPAVHNFEGRKVKFQVSESALIAMKALARQEQVTLFMCLLAIFQLLLSRYSGQTDVLVGSAMTNRIRTELEPLIGLFVNTIPLRTDLGGDLTFRELLARVRKTCLGAFSNMDLPFEETVRVLQPERDLSRQGSPLFQYMIINQPPGQQRADPGTGFRPGESHHDTGFSNFDILLSTHEIRDQRIDCTLAYDTDLYLPETIDSFIQRFLLLFDDVISEPDLPLSRFALITDEEQSKLLGDWSGSRVQREERPVHIIIDDLANRFPERTALVFGHESMSYSELSRLGTSLALRLTAAGVGRADLVALCAERGMALIAGMLAILKAGAAFVPMDPAYPRERLRYILEDTGCRVVLCDSSFDRTLPGDDEEVILVDLDRSETEPSHSKWTGVDVGLEDPAYVIYTSGSTGTPKGVVVEHGNLTNIIRAQREMFPIDGDSRVLQMLSISFDAAIGEVFRTLTAGATLYLAPRDSLLPGPSLLNLLRSHRITTTAISPTALASLSMPPDGLPDLQTLIVGGEACPPKVAARWGEGRTLINGYGPTETTIGATFAKNWDLGGKPPLGRPLPGVCAYVLDAQMRLVPPGMVGELYIGGVGVSRGYLHQPELTASRFIPNPFENSPDARLYRTGDLVRWRSDGFLDFVGRADQQVKVRGFRIELGEIESALARHPGVDQCAVKVHEVQGLTRLAAFFVCATSDCPDQSELREFLKQHLPEYMIPAGFMRLDKLPMTANGKIDKAALPEPVLELSVVRRKYAAPDKPDEKRLASIWSTVLGLPRIGLDDNFFEIGGDSISSIRVVARAQEAGIELDPKDIFRYQTVRELAAYLSNSRSP